MIRQCITMAISLLAVGAALSDEAPAAPRIRGLSWGATQQEVRENRDVKHERDSLDLTDSLIEIDSIGSVPVSVRYSFFNDSLYEISIESPNKESGIDLSAVFAQWREILVEKYGRFSGASRRPEDSPAYFESYYWIQNSSVPAIDLVRTVYGSSTLKVRIHYFEPMMYVEVQRISEAKVKSMELDKY